MSNDKVRSEFEAAYVAWLVSTGWDKDSALLSLEISKNGDYFSTSAQGAWWGWKASRAALVVELPPKISEFNTDENGFVNPAAAEHDEAIDDCRAAIEAAGIKIKE